MPPPPILDLDRRAQREGMPDMVQLKRRTAQLRGNAPVCSLPGIAGAIPFRRPLTLFKLPKRRASFQLR